MKRAKWSLCLLSWVELRVAELCWLRRRREIDIRLCEYFSPLSVLFLDGAFIIGNPERKLDLSMNPMFLE